jgi:beta-phosphoglucomutase
LKKNITAKYKGVIFDLDGVIVHTDKMHYAAWKSLADRLEIPFDEEVNNRLRGVSRTESLEIILERSAQVYSDAQKLRFSEEKNESYLRYLDGLSPHDVSPEVIDTLRLLKGAGLKIAIGSSSKNAKTILKNVGLTDFFDAVSDGTNIEKTKPDPEVFLKAAAMLRLAPSECAVVEDAITGIEAAVRGGFTAIAIGNAASSNKAEFNITSISELQKIILGDIYAE